MSRSNVLNQIGDRMLKGIVNYGTVRTRRFY